MLFTSATIGQSNYFGFGFTTLNWKPLYRRGNKVNRYLSVFKLYFLRVEGLRSLFDKLHQDINVKAVCLSDLRQ